MSTKLPLYLFTGLLFLHLRPCSLAESRENGLKTKQIWKSELTKQHSVAKQLFVDGITNYLRTREIL